MNATPMPRVLAVLIPLFALTACETEPPEQQEDVGTFAIQWLLEGGCPTGATSVSVMLDGEPHDAFDCESSATFRTDSHPLGSYEVALAVTDDAGQTYALSDPQTVDLDADVVPISFAFPSTEGTFTFGWEMRQQDGLLDCVDSGVDGFHIRLDNTDTGNAYLLRRICSEGVSSTGFVVVGPYTISVALVDDNDDTITTLPDTTATIEHGNQVVDLGVFSFVP